MEKMNKETSLKDDPGSLLACILNAATQAIIGKSVEGEIFRWSRGAEKLSGYSSDEAIGKHVSFLFPPDKWEAVSRLFEKAMSSGLIENLETAWVRKDGSIRQVLMNIAAIQRSGETMGFTIIGQDITERIEIQEALHASELRYRRLFETAQDGVLLIDASDEKIYDANPYLLDMLGYNGKEIIGMKLWEIGPVKNVEASRGAFRDLLEQGATRFENLPLETKDGRIINVEFVSNVYQVNGRKVIQCNIRDITERKLLERQKGDFYAMVTHDIKSPLTVIAGFTELLRNELADKMTVPENEMLLSIEKSGKRLEELVENFLTISTIESGRLTFNPVSADLADALSDILMDFETRYKKKRIIFKQDLPSGLPKIPIDLKLIQRAVTNLLENANNYTQADGTVSLRAELLKDKNELVITVADTGQGIPKEEQPHLFEKYYRSSRVAGTKGSGLGLSIVKAAAEAHGGYVEVESEIGMGSKFSIILPAGMEKREAA